MLMRAPKQMSSVSSRASFSSIRAEAPPTENGSNENFGYLVEVIDRLIPDSLARTSMELDVGGTPLGTEMAIDACVRGESSTGDYAGQEDIPDSLRPRIKKKPEKRLSRSLDEFLAELLREKEIAGGLATLERSQDLETTEFSKFRQGEPYRSKLPTTTTSILPLEINTACEEQTFSVPPIIRHDNRFSIADAAAISVMLGRSLPSIPESADEQTSLSEGTRSYWESYAEESAKVPQSTLENPLDTDPEAHIHPVHRTRNLSASPPLILYEGADEYLENLSSKNPSQQNTARQTPSSAYVGLESSPIPCPSLSGQRSVDESLFCENIQASPPSYAEVGSGNASRSLRSRHYYSNSTPDFSSHKVSISPPRQTPLTKDFAHLDNGSCVSNMLEIHSSSPAAPNTFKIAPLVTPESSCHSAQYSRDVHHGFPIRDPAFTPSDTGPRTERENHLDIILEAQPTKRIQESRHSQSLRDSSTKHNESVQQLNKKHLRSVSSGNELGKRTQSIRDSRTEHEKGVQQFNQKHLRSVSSGHELGNKPSLMKRTLYPNLSRSFTPPPRPPPPLPLSSTNMFTLHALSQPYVYPIHPYPHLPSYPYPQSSHPYPQQLSMHPQPTDLQRERLQRYLEPLQLVSIEPVDDDTCSTTVEAGDSEGGRAAAELVKQSAVEKIARVLGKEAAAAQLAKINQAAATEKHEGSVKGLLGGGKKMMRWIRGK